MDQPRQPIRNTRKRVPGARRSAARAARRQGIDRTMMIGAYIAPALIGMFLLNIVPMCYNAYISLTNRNGPTRFAEGTYQVQGFENYGRILGDSDFYAVLGKTLLYAGLCVGLFVGVGLGFALILNNPAIKGRAIWRTLLILPWAVPTWITALNWKFLFHGQYGPINQILRLAGVEGPEWLLGGTTAFIAVTIVNLWASYPFFMLIFLGGLKSIPADVYEAASLDGAGWWRQLFSITLPMLRPVALPAVILSAMQTFQMFNIVWLMTKGGPVQRVGEPGATEILLIWAYNQGFQGGQRFGLMAAFSMLVFVLLLGLTAIYVKLSASSRAAYD